MKRRGMHIKVFVLAGLYNIGWALYSSLYPQWLFEYADMELLNQPVIFACLAMVIGVYGLLYLEVARRPEHGFAIAAVGLLGKVLGPIGMAYLVLTDTWPVETVVLVLTNDLVWWIPFAMYLRDSWPQYRQTLSASA